MQNTKDSFLLMLRDRLSVVNPERTCVVRGATRAAVLAAENELASAEPEAGEVWPAETFVVRWGEPYVDTSEAMPLLSLPCEIAYWTVGSDLAAGMDRGRVLTAMDGELRQMLLPAFTAKQDCRTLPPTPMRTNVFWSAASFGAVVKTKLATGISKAGRVEAAGAKLSRVARLTVFGLEEAGEQ